MKIFEFAFRLISFVKNASINVFGIRLMSFTPEDKHAVISTTHAVHCTMSYENYVFIESL